MTSNPFVERLSADVPILGTMSTTRAPSVIEVAGDIGLDFVWIDLEARGPSGTDGPALESLQRAAEAAGIQLLVRLPPDEPTMLQTVLNTGVDNVIVADVRSAKAVEDIIETSRFRFRDRPGGRWASFSRSNRFGNPEADYPTIEDREKCIGVMVENREAVAAIDDIVAIPELDFVRIGAADLSIQLGHPYELSHPTVRNAIADIESACRSAGMPISKKIDSPTAFEEAQAAGYRVLTIGRDLSILRSVLQDRFSSMLERIES